MLRLRPGFRACCSYLHTCRPSFSEQDFSMEKPVPFQLEHVQQRLIETVPEFFRQRLDYTFYKKDVIVENHITSQKFVGIDRLQAHFGQLAVAGKIFFPHVDMEVVDCYPQLEDGTVRLKWRVKYVSFLSLLLRPRLFRMEYRLNNLSWYEGYSVFSVNGNGAVHHLTIQRMRQDDSYLLSDSAKKIKEKIKVAVDPAGNAPVQISKDS